KPRDEDEARAMLASIAGKEVRISSGSVLITTIPSGETILAREGVVMRIALQQYSHEAISEYLREQRGFQSVAGVIDFAHPSAQRLIAPKPVRIERLTIEQDESPRRQVCVDPALLAKMRDYCIGVPKEMIQEMIRQVEDLK
ncbi:MAG: Maf family protein, partial [Candidatus Komeilibacteria bacterium]|nr:Maf family protein [Candidatus Komeilibacteria bacterium]